MRDQPMPNSSESAKNTTHGYESSKKPNQASIIHEDRAESFIKEGKVLAHTINAPFTTIPFIPAATPILKKFDKATGQDLGFTYKASLSSETNKQGAKDLIYKIDYIGFGVMSSKFNIQVAPLAAKIELGKEVYKGFGCNLSTLASPIGFVHERLGVKATVTDCNNKSKSISVAEEVSYQRSSSFKPISTVTAGYFFGNDATVRIPAEYVPALERIAAASPNLNEWKIIGTRIGLSIPAAPLTEAFERGLQTLKMITKLVESEISYKTKKLSDYDHKNNVGTEVIKIPTLAEHRTNTEELNHSYVNQIRHKSANEKITKHPTAPSLPLRASKDLKPSIEEKANYFVQPNDSLDQIGKKTGHTWMEIFALNRNTLKNSPDKIYPGQELLIPENHTHAALMHHPIVQARISANMAKQAQHSIER